MVLYSVHTLANGATVIVTSPHGFKFSDGTACEGNPELAKQLTLNRLSVHYGDLKGMALNKVTFVLKDAQVDLLRELSKQADVVIVPIPVLLALYGEDIRHELRNVVAFNATAETQRLPPNEKVVDIHNWSY